MLGDTPIVSRMQSLILQWERDQNPQAFFLRCYQMMTRNMLAAIDNREFQDPAWVHRLLHLFAQYYFGALDAYWQQPSDAPLVWELAHNTALTSQASPLQNLMLGINAHINYDLVLTMVDLLKPEWQALSTAQRASRYADYSLVNEIIARTIDAVQDDVLEPAMPLMRIVDKLMGPCDEYLVSGVLTRWRETVWQNTCQVLDASTEDEQRSLLQQVEKDALRLGRVICFED